MDTYLAMLSQSLVRWGPALVFAAMFLECVPFVGFIMPGLTILVLTGFLSAGQSDPQALLLFAAALAGIVLSDTLAFWIGAAGVTRSARIRRMVEKREALRREIAGQKDLVLVLYQFPPYSRMFAPLVMGAAGVAWRRWWLLVGVGSLAFVGAFFLLGRIAGVAGRELADATGVAEQVSGAFVLALLVWLAVIVTRLLRRRRAAA